MPERLAPPPRTRRWALPLAAALTLALLGLSAWQTGQLAEQRARIDRLSGELAAVDARSEGLASVNSLLEEAQLRLAMLTSPGAEYCLLKPAGERPPQPEARGTLVVAPDRRSWYLRVEGLEPSREGGAYQLWFITEDGFVAGPAFRMSADADHHELASDQIPSSFRAVSLTLETEGRPPAPSGQPVLYADQAMQLL